jgi:hypothetical protein
MRIVKASARPSKAVKANTSRKFRSVRADEDIDIDIQEDMPAEGGATVAPEATDMLFEAEDVAELVAEVSGQEVTVEVDDADDSVIFTVGEEEFTVEPDGEEEIVESSRRVLKNSKAVRASRKVARPARKVAASSRGRKSLRRR